MKHITLRTALLAFTALSMPSMASASSLNQYIGFGDSTLDTGYYRNHSTDNPTLDADIVTAISNGATGAFVGTGVMNSIILAGKFGLTAAPIGGGGTVYAIGGTQTYATIGPEISTYYQIDNYLSSVNGVANSRALYVIATGSNDLHDAQVSTPGWLETQAAALGTQAARLQAAGARTILATSPYNYAIYAELGGEIAPANTAVFATSMGYRNMLWASLTASGVNFVPVDEESVFRYVVKNPTLFGFTPASVLAVNAPCFSSSAILCTSMSPADMQSFLFVDGKHMTTAGQTIVADLEYSLLTAPNQISLIGEGEVQAGLTRASTIQGQIDLSGQQRGPNGINAWVSAGANSLRIKNERGFPNDSGTPFRGTAGVDYLTSSGVVVGAAFSGGAQRQGFSTGGSYDQVDFAPSLYAAYKTGPVWGDAVATYGYFDDHIARNVTLGRFIDRNQADTTGQSLALALRGGGDFDAGQAITTGPVAGVVMQQVRLDGFTETGTSGATALSFGTQTRDSFVSQLGWRGSMDLGRWKPFAEAAWNHEWAGKDNRVSASLTSASVGPFYVDAAPQASDWATASLGTSFQLNPRMALRASVSTVFANPQVVSYGGECGLSIGF